MGLQLRLPTFLQHCRIASRPRIIQHHRFLKELEPIDFLNRARGGVYIIKDDKGLALCF